MRRGLILGFWAAVLSLACGFAFANAPLKSMWPMPRPMIIYLSPSATLAPYSSPRPMPRPNPNQKQDPVQDAIQADVIAAAIKNDGKARRTLFGKKKRKTTVAQQISTVISPFAVARSLIPKKRPKGLRLARIDPKTRKAGKPVRYNKKGSVCGVKGIRGYSVKRVQGKISGCRIENPVKISEVDGVRFTREILVGCDAAKSLYSWVHKSAKPIVGRRGGGLAKIQMIAGYSCRNRNSKKGGKLSEHAKGKAMDIAGFVLKDGSTLSVLKDWRSASKGPTLKRLHKAACGPFGTVLGPQANRYHQDHLHFDVARYRSGAYCR